MPGYDGDGFRPNGLNVAEILRVADAVERSGTYDQTFCHHACGTPACIAGHVVGHGHQPTWDAARDILGLTDKQAYPLFAACPLGFFSEAPTNAHAAACLRHLAKTGEVDWAATKPKIGEQK